MLPWPTWSQHEQCAGVTTPSAPNGLAASRATLLTEIGFDNNTTQFVTAQAMRARVKMSACSHSVPREFTTDANTLFAGHDSVRTGAGPGVTGIHGDGHVVQSNNMAMTQNAVTNFAQNNAGQHGVGDRESDGESIDSTCKPKKKKSGMVACAIDNIKTPQVWPHYNLLFGFVTSAVQFHQLSFEQYIAGETKTILTASDPLEIRGCITLMS